MLYSENTWLHPLTLPPCRRSSHFEESLKMMRGRWNQNRLETFTTIQSESAETLPENSEQREIKCAVCQKRSLTSDDPHQGQGTKGVSAGCVSPPLSQFLSFYEKKKKDSFQKPFLSLCGECVWFQTGWGYFPPLPPWPQHQLHNPCKRMMWLKSVKAWGFRKLTQPVWLLSLTFLIPRLSSEFGGVFLPI